MAESKKGASSSANSKEKSSLLDLDIGKDFLSSWKSMSVAEDIDFDFGSVTKGKKKAFSFDKMDMDFNLDGDFDKISSFKVDMSDLDISSDTKKQENPRKRSKEVSAGEIHKGKTDRFEFPFDFNELDNISFDSTLTKEDKKSKKNQDKEESSNRSETVGSGIQLSDDVGAAEEGITQKLPALGSLTIPKNDIQPGRVGEIDSVNEDACSNFVAKENWPSKSAEVVDQIEIQGTRTSPEKTVFTTTRETNEESSRPVNTTSPGSNAHETMLTIQETGSNLQKEVSTVPAELNNSSGWGQNFTVKSVAGLGSDHENAPLENLPPQSTSISQSPNSEMNRYVSDDHALVSEKDDTEPIQGDLQLEHTSVTTVSKELPHGTWPNGENQDSNAKLLLAPLNRGTTVNKSVPENDKETGVVRSKFFKRVGETESHLQKEPLSHKKLVSFGSKRIGSVPLSHADESMTLDATNAQGGSQLAGPGSHSRDLTRGEPIEIGSQESVKSLSSTWEVVSTKGTESGAESLATSRIHDQDAKKGENVLEGSEKNVKSLITFSSHVNPSNLSERKNKSTSQDFVNPRLSVSSMKSLQSAKKICIERNKISPPNLETRTPDLSRLRISRDSGSNPNLLKSRFQKDINSSRNSEQIMESQGNRESKIAHFAVTQKQTSPAPILKRKAFEESNAASLTLNPAKRLSESPKEDRNIREPSERVIDKQVFNHVEDNTRSVNSDNEIPTLGIPREVKMTELEAPLAIETESNVEKAEACTKELEDMCNMLKKKHEEAKELLVRAIVNNNNLLMLNHPIYEEKISMVQKKFAALLMSD